MLSPLVRAVRKLKIAFQQKAEKADTTYFSTSVRQPAEQKHYRSTMRATKNSLFNFP